MKVPLSWLRELVEVDASADEIAERLSLHTTAVESIERTGGRVSGVVVAEVLDVSDVPVSEKLCVAQVDAGGAGRFQVVAGAKNFRMGDRVALAAPGARVTTLDQPIGVRVMAKEYESQGMLCSANELGVTDDHGGILVLDPRAPLGADVAAMLDLDDVVIELEVTPNRPDLMSIAGVAREVGALFEVPMRPWDREVVESGAEVAGVTSVTIDDPRGCPRYLARVIDGVSFAPSPPLAQARLAKAGFRPLGNLVDATNYVLVLTGQPLHAFDLDRLAEERIVVRAARPDERLRTLDGAEHTLCADDLVIADAADAQALAGVMGGQTSEVGTQTSRILLESAFFDPMRIARTARRLGIVTEASRRFERGADPEAVPRAAALCADLLREWAGGRVARGAVDAGRAPTRRRVGLRRGRVRVLLGVDIPPARQDRFLAALGCALEAGDEAVEVTVPSWRPDLEREVDLLEEIGRLHGFDGVPGTVPTGTRGFLTKSQLLRRRIREVLMGCGLSEAILPSFLSDADLASVGYTGDVVRLANPMSRDQDTLRPTLVPSMLSAARHNASRGVRDVRLFEVATTFVGWPADRELPDESFRIGIVLAGNAQPDAWHATPRPVDALDVKGVLEVLFDGLGLRDWGLGPCEAMPYHPGRSASILVAGAEIGRFGELRPSVRAAYDLDGGAAVAELDLEPLVRAAPDRLRTNALPRFPAVTRDIALTVAEEVHADEIVSAIAAGAGDDVESVLLFDLYRGDPIPAGRKSLALRVTLRAAERTLTAEDADAARASAIAALRDRFDAEIR